MKRCLITHVADPDGAFPIILSKLIFDNMDFYSCEKSEVDGILNKVLRENYDNIYIVDLNMSFEMAKMINEKDELKNKVSVFDHHQSEEYLNKYPFIHVVVEQNGKKECGTTLYYEYLKKITNQEILNKKSLVTMVELVRQNDTFDFTDDLKNVALNFRNLYDIYGREKYIEHFLEFILENETFEFTGVEKELIKLEEECDEFLSAIEFTDNENIIEEFYDVIQVMVNILDKIDTTSREIESAYFKHHRKLLERGWEFKK